MTAGPLCLIPGSQRTLFTLNAHMTTSVFYITADVRSSSHWNPRYPRTHDREFLLRDGGRTFFLLLKSPLLAYI